MAYFAFAESLPTSATLESSEKFLPLQTLYSNMFFFYIFGLGLEISIIIWYNNISLIICKICKIKDISLSHEALFVKTFFFQDKMK